MMSDEERYAMLNTPVLPEGAGDYAEGLIKIMNRIPPGWGRWISCDKGWFPILVEANEQLEFIDPNYEIHQIKEKFGTLRFYFNTEFDYETIQHKIMESIICYAEEKSARTCEVCGTNEYGKTVKNRQIGYWYKTECLECAKERGYEEDIPEEEQ